MPLQETGVRAEVQDLDVFLSGIKQMNDALGQMAKAITQTSGETAKSAPSMDKMGIAMGVVTGGTTALVSGVLSLAGSLASNLLGAINKVTSSITGMAQQGLMLAGRFNEMENAAIAIGRSYGITDDATRESIELLEDAGIRYDVAAQSAAQLIRNQIDLANATDLASVAQATGILIGADSSETMSRLIHAISTGNTAMLTYMGITVTKNDIDQEALELYGRTTEALTGQEKMQARVNAIIKASVPIMGVYGSAMESPTKALRSLTGRELPTLGATMMQTFLPAFKTGVDAVRGFVKALNAAMDEGGSLYPILVKLGAAASLVADAFKAAVDWVVGWINNLNLQISDGATNTIELMAEWGVEMIATFADAIVQTASSVLTKAMEYIGSILSWWMSPGSPPRIAPDLDKWGMEAIGVWLGGMTKADFGALSDIQNTLAKFLSGPEMRDISVKLAGALSGGMGLDVGIFDTIAAAAGDFGAEVSTLVQQQLLLARATEMVEAAEERLRQAREAVSTAQENTTKLTKEYNELLKGSASQEVLNAKLAEINASEEQMDLAQAQVEEAEAAKKEAEAIINPLQEQVELQKLLIDQLMRLTAEEEKRAQAAMKSPALGKGKGLGVDDLIDTMIPDPSDMGDEITNRISEAIETAKADLQARLSEIFAPLATTWEESISPTLTRLRTDFETFVTNIQTAWQTFLDSDIYKTISEFWNNLPSTIAESVEAFMDQEGLLKALEPFTEFIDQLTEDVSGKSISEWLTDIFNFGFDDLFDLLKGLGKTEFPQWMKDIFQFGFDDLGNYILGTEAMGKIKSVLTFGFDDIFRIVGTKMRDLWNSVTTSIGNVVNSATTKWSEFWNNLKSAVATGVTEIKSIINSKIEGLFETLGIDLEETKKRIAKIWEDIQAIAEEIWRRITETVSGEVEEAQTRVEDIVDAVRSWLSEKWEQISRAAKDAWNAIATWITTKVREIKTKIQEVINSLKTWWDTKWQQFVDTVARIWQKIKDTFKVQEFVDIVVTAIKGMIEGVKTWIDDNIERFKELGKAILRGLREGVISHVRWLVEAVISAVEGAISGAKAALGIACPDPSPVFAEMGQGMMEGLKKGIESFAPGVQAQLNAVVSPANIHPVASTGVAGGSTTFNRTSNVTIGSVVVSGDMGFAEFSAKVERAILAMA